MWFAALVLTADTSVLSESAQTLAARVVIERPGFSFSEELGIAILRLFDVAPGRSQAAVAQLLTLPNVERSVAAALKFFAFDGRISKFGDKTIWLSRQRSTVGDQDLPVPSQGALPLSTLSSLVAAGLDDAFPLLRAVRPWS
jgi:hypothetical protein